MNDANRCMRPGTSSLLFRSLFFHLALCFLAANVVQAQVPTQVPFQGLLLDSGGTPVNGSVDLDFTLFDAIVGGTNLWTETHLGVIVVDGIYSVNLGSTVALEATVLTGGSRFLEIKVSGETLVPRQQFLSVPYALVSENVGEVSSFFLEQVAEHFLVDGQEPPNQDPREGLGDTDGDGIANFADADNDGDQLDDATELDQGTDINLVTPNAIAISPGSVHSNVPTTVHVTGTALDTVATAIVSGLSPTPYNVTSTSFDIDFLYTGGTTVATFRVTLANGQTDATPLLLSFSDP